MTQVTPEQVLSKLATDDKFAVNLLMQMYARQTEEEQISGTTRVENRAGFNALDADILSSFAEQVKAWRQEENPRYSSPLSVKQMALLRKKLPTYRKQLTDITNAALAAKAGAEPTAEPVSERQAATNRFVAAHQASPDTAMLPLDHPSNAHLARVAVDVMTAPLYRPVTATEHFNARKFVAIFGTAADVAKFDANNPLPEAPPVEEPGYDSSVVDAEDRWADELREDTEGRRLDGRLGRRQGDGWSDPPIPRIVETRTPVRFPEEMPLEDYDLSRVSSPSCRLIVDGAGLRFPKANEVNNWSEERKLRYAPSRATGGRDELTGYNELADPFVSIPNQ